MFWRMLMVLTFIGIASVLGLAQTTDDGSVPWPTPKQGLVEEPQVICDPRGGGTYCYVVCTKTCGGMDWECYGFCLSTCVITCGKNLFCILACPGICWAQCYVPSYCCEGYIRCRTISPCPG